MNDEFHKWLDNTYGNPNIGAVKAVCGKRHDYLAMTLDFNIPGKLKVDMCNYVKQMVEELKPEERGKSNGSCPWNDKLFTVSPTSPRLNAHKAERFHRVTAKGLFVAKRARQDINPAIAFFCTKVQAPSNEDWGKLQRMIKFLEKTKNDCLILEADNLEIIHWYLDASFAVHFDFKSHTGAVLTLGTGSINSKLTKHKINTRSSMEAEVISMDNIISPVLWTKLFMEAKGFKIKQNIIMCDYVKQMIEELKPEERKKSNGSCPWNDKFFTVSPTSPRLNAHKTERFHHITAKGLFVAKRARQDINPAIAFFCTRV